MSLPSFPSNCSFLTGSRVSPLEIPAEDVVSIPFTFSDFYILAAVIHLPIFFSKSPYFIVKDPMFNSVNFQEQGKHRYRVFSTQRGSSSSPTLNRKD